jgi:hypothetical protein
MRNPEWYNIQETGIDRKPPCLLLGIEWSESDNGKFNIHRGLNKILGTTRRKLHQEYICKCLIRSPCHNSSFSCAFH